MRTGPFEQSVVAQGGEPTDVAKSFFAEFGGLCLLLPPRLPTARRETVEFDPTIVAYEPEELQECSKRLSSPVCPVGIWNAGLIGTLLMSQNSRVYVDFDDDLLWLGRCGHDAIEALCTHRAYRYPRHL